MKHRHHKIPLHAGGTNDPDNIELLTVEEHANAHKILFKKYGRWQDKLAYNALSGHIGKEEIIRELQSLSNIGRRLPEKSRNQISKKLIGRSLTEEHKKKISKGVLDRYSDLDFAEKQRKAASFPGTTNPFYGRKHTDEFKKRQSILRSKHYVCVSPKGDIFNVFNLSEFCRKHSLNRGNMGAGGTKGWICKRRIL